MAMTKADIAGLIPHTGAMCLLDEVLRWDAAQISCLSRTHRDADNPMRAGGQLPSVCGIEYAAQAMAVHGGLAGKVGSRPRSGYLVALRNVICRHDRLDNLEGDLVVDAVQLMGDEGRVIYQFALRVGAVEVLSGRATVVLDAATARPQTH
ncbi:MAG: hydroxymyristoyl-ACP dehydratase [Betaproteobacteria bacterium]|nr:hydroxymyristoyl-ACP dehydratase [Betaproteobacteria bacterium]